MRFGSFCSGIGAPEAAWTALGWSPAFFAEIEPFPCAVLAHHYPGVPNLGDMTKITHEQIEQYAGVDVVVAGTPCQSFSVAGLRKGLDDPRGNLALVFLGLVDRLRPRWLVWENVDGVRSSGDGRDFGSFLGALGQLGYGWAYRVLDAQYGGVPQRRRRVFVVGHLGDWRRAAAVLLERESLCGNPPPGREAGSRVAGTLAARPSGGGGLGTEFETDGGLTPVAFYAQGGTRDVGAGAVSPSLKCGDGNAGYQIGVVHPQPFIVHSENSTAMREGGTVPAAFPAKVSRSLDTTGGYSHNQGGTVVSHPVAFNWQTGGSKARLGYDPDSRVAGTLQADQIPAVAFQTRFARNGRGAPEEVCPTLQGASAGATSDMRPCVVTPTMAVRRLTPLDCERLMGFPDGYSAVPFRGKPASDGPRYRALGNSMVTNELNWIGRRIQAVEAVR